MAKQLNVSMNFQANVSQAKGAIQELQAALTKVATGNVGVNIDPSKMKAASAAAKELQVHLLNATNVDTGKLDLSKLDKSLKSSKMNIQDLSMSLLQAGAGGEQAFVKLAQSIAAADRPMLALNAKMKEFATTLANTARWQISSSILHGFMGAVQEAYGYAQDLNKSLNNIRIVTGMSSDQMAKFAEQANKSAKALSATTTEYTDAALIFYQQGLSSEEVAKRTDVTIKMAHAAGESAESVSSYMTAIWNNFDDGTKSLEYYGDVITKLGAATAASSEEIAAGLEKFVSIGETIGLSYEYATAAVTTIVDKTRQSADTVGTALKTIFARLQGLKLGETLEDGVELNKYSAALEKVGVDVLDVSGNLRNADDIIKDLGETWDDLSRAQQTAVAQTVAGTRQYTQLLALMNNFDSFEQNVDMAADSEGTLKEQQAIYEESWEAASDRVTASLQAVYNQLIDDDFFIGLANGFSGLIDSLNGFIDGIGGLKGVISGIAIFFMANFAGKIQPAIDSISHNFKVMFSSAAEQARMLSGEMNSVIEQTLASDMGKQFSDSSKVALNNAMQLNEAKAKLSVVENSLNATEKQRYDLELNMIQMTQDEAQAIADKITKRKEEIALLSEAFDYASATKDLSNTRGGEEEKLIAAKKNAEANYINDDSKGNKQAYTQAVAELNEHRLATERLMNAREQYSSALYDSYVAEMAAHEGSIEKSTQVLNLQSMMPEMVDHYTHALAGLQSSNDLQHQKQTFSEIKNEIELIVGDSCPALSAAMDKAMSMKTPEAFKKGLSGVISALKESEISGKDLEKILKKMGQGASVTKIKKSYKDLAKEMEQLKQKQEAVNRAVKEFNPKHISGKIESITKVAAGFGQVAMSIQSARSMLETWNNEDMTTGEKLVSTLMSISMIVPSIIGSFKSFNSVLLGNQAIQLGLSLAAQKYAVAESQKVAAMSAEAIATKFKISADQAELVLMRAKAAEAVKQELQSSKNIAAMTAEQLVQKTGMTMDQAETVLNKLKAASEDEITDELIEQSLAEAGLTTMKGSGTLATIAQTAANWALNASMWEITLVIILIVALLAGLVIGVMAVVSAFEAWKASTPEGKLKMAQEESARLSEELTKAKEASDKLKSSIEGYDSAIEKMKQLEKGTKEYNEAVKEANAHAQEMIDSGAVEAGQYSFNADTGLIEFEDGALEAAQEKADKKVASVQSQKLMADNMALSAQNDIDKKDVVKNDNGRAAGEGALAGLASGGPIGAAIGAAMGGIAAAINDNNQSAALDKLQQAYEESNGNIAAALNSLDPATRAMVDQLGKTEEELGQLCATTAQNTEAILQNNKQIIDANLQGNEAYDNSEHKDFLNTVMAEDMAAKTDELYESTYKDGKMSDADAQKAYAKMMGWDENLVQNKSGNKAVYVNDAGEEVTISDEAARKYLAQQEALTQASEGVEQMAEKTNDLARMEKMLAASADGSIESYEKYTQEMIEYGKTLGFTEDQVKSFLETEKSQKMQTAANKKVLSDNIQEWHGASKEESDKAVEKAVTKMGENEDLNKILSKDEQVELMVKVSAESNSLDEFARNLEAAANDAILTGYQNASAGVESIEASAEETGQISAADMDVLEQDELFQEYLEQSGQDMLDFTTATYAEKRNIIAGYYAELKASESEALQNSKDNYQADLAEYQAILDYKRAMESGDSGTANKIAEEFSEIDFTAYADMDITEIESKMDEVQDAIDEIDGQQLKLDLEWDTTDSIEKGLKQSADFAKTMEKDAKKVGDSYQLTAAQAKDWMQMYPELFAEAEVTNDGLISLNQAQVDSYVKSQDEQVDANIDANIEKLQLRISELESEKEAYLADIELAKANAFGKEQLETASAEYLAETRDKLTQYYIDSGLDEVSAQKAALNTMGLNQKEYSTLVAEAHSRNAENQIASSEQGATGMLAALKKLWEKVKNWGKAVGNLFKNVWGALTGKVKWSEVWGAFDGGSIDSGVTVNGIKAYDKNGNFQEGAESARTAVLEQVNAQSVKDMELKVTEIDNTIASLNSEIAYNQALKNQDLSDYGSTDPDEVDGTKDKDKSKDKSKDNKKTVEELIEISERYHEITREVAALEHQLELVGKAKDRAFGASKLQAMDDEIAAMKKLAEKQTELYKAQQLYLMMDQAKVNETFSGAQFGYNGEILNYSDLVAQAANELNAAKKTYNNSAQEDADKEKLEAAEKRYEEKTEILKQYEETVDATRESELALQEAFDNIHAANAEKLSYEMELQVTLKDADLKQLDYYLNKTGDDFYQRAEGLAIMNKQVDVYTGQMTNYSESLDKWNTAYANKDIDQQQYIDGLTELQDGMYGDLEALQELDDQMMHYYGETLAAAQEEIDKTTSRLEQQTAMLEHYMTILDLMGESADYEKVGVILAGKAETTKNEMIAAKEEYLMFAQEAEERYAAWQAATNEAEAELLKQQYEDALAASDEAQEEYLSKAESYAESLKAILENSLNQYAQDLENALTGGTSFDQMNSKLERAASLQEEYLTTTNKIYETNKMINTAQQAIDKSTNTVAKQRLKQFISETDQLQKKNKLSQYELDIQQAKYELLLAEIALEEARDAKTTVRLQRDSEGNFGYVYTADQDKIAEAEQKLADAQNALYNIGLEGAQTYMEKYSSTLNEMYDTLTELQTQYLEGAFESEEEYQNAVAEAKQYYYQLLEDYSDLYTIAISTDAQVLEDSWTSEFKGMVDGTETWKDEVNIYIGKVDESFRLWEKDMKDLAGELGVGGSLEDLKDAVGDVTSESKKLVDYTKNTVIPMAKSEIDAVEEVTAAYAKKRQELLKYLESVEDLSKAIDKIRREEAAKTEEKTPPPDRTATGGSGSGSDSGSGGGTTTPAKSVSVGGLINAKQAKIYDYKGDTSGETQTFKNDPKYKVLKTDGDWIQVRHHSLSKGITGWFKKGDVTALDTGGYTGSWGSYGKLAFLHEKELILNKEDTANLLSSMELLNNIIQAIDLRAANSQIGGMLNSPALGNVGADVLEQMVTIEANFPNVSSRVEIEEAFSTLVNRASQYANRS